MGIESRGKGSLIEREPGDEMDFESEFTHAGVEAMEAAEDSDVPRKEAALQNLERLFGTPDVQGVRLPGEEEVFTQGYERLAEQLGAPRKYRLNDNGDIEPLASAPSSK